MCPAAASPWTLPQTSGGTRVESTLRRVMARMTLSSQMCSYSLMPCRHHQRQSQGIRQCPPPREIRQCPPPRGIRQNPHRGTRQHRHPRGTHQRRHPRATRQDPHPQVDRQQHPPTFLQIPTQLESTICRSGPIPTLNKISKSWRTKPSLSRSSR